jgi:DNA mismatch endonuclease (patch repair protein)
MADVHEPEVRSYNMSRIKGKDTKPELLVRKYLYAHGIRYRLHDKSLPGKPDIVIRNRRLAIFVHGCFWHGHEGCKYFVMPKTRTEWWQEKIARNTQRDEKKREQLEALGFQVITVWECGLKPNKIESTFRHLKVRILKINF